MHKENPLASLKNPLFFVQASTSGAGGVLGSFAYAFASASVITAAQRSFAVLWSMLSGNFYFNERQMKQKIFSLALIVLGLILLI
ncbi:hypothetical protein A3B05_03025 [Candidatus Giovannonibacteria bacterium RIFCSPLOWO2_01_FULL_43_160]|uniref:EamA domain-containing protein n=2 Tax=Candidatus Giovannoniibacteriota TaxID=1752738 RepID=A0A0G1IWL1_9BACT|nr:MAG: hypothetical protein UV72_C0010G0014 [Candidatus Giovannonibacteria bacterium GW2011_GWB1_43_13]KKS99534.1 MAG: hypothetical protein UV75_C0003G0010 [Candidatus Giovannonibacteria bacterium GW2011_GWA1_43_15]KKT21430.1 MAG: hypothetical protein UW05_C0010G0010 [Candidatus Giovannonibacteria bacterium GW2011_GWC2_43_8]KKT63480.1 MAG: hypothetical protein UW55_C0003G0048 [Candidatus Giovannonibacteria bacterium GW2011_GWA2_44_26]OGF58133.1 MAG: hypothetical protein A2652_02830 [Candidatus